MAACPYWQTHDASPGEPNDPGELLALDLYQAIQQHGWEYVTTLLSLRFTPAEAEALYHRLDTLKTLLPQMQQRFQGGAPDGH